MAEVANNSNEQPKKQGRTRSNPRIDMTPMVDLAFLLLTFFVLTSNMHKAHTMEIAVPGEGVPMPLSKDIAKTVLIGDGKLYYYAGKFDIEKGLSEVTLDADGLRQVIADANATIQEQAGYLTRVYTGGKFTQTDYTLLEEYLRASTAPYEGEAALVTEAKQELYSSCIALMDRDVKAGEMGADTYKKVGSAIRGADAAPFFVVKWDDKAKYADVVSVLDELKIGQVSKYAVAPVSEVEEIAMKNTESENSGNNK